MTYEPGDWIPPYDVIARTKAAFIVGEIDFPTFERLIGSALRGRRASITAAVPFGSELKDRLLVSVDSSPA